VLWWKGEKDPDWRWAISQSFSGRIFRGGGKFPASGGGGGRGCGWEQGARALCGQKGPPGIFFFGGGQETPQVFEGKSVFKGFAGGAPGPPQGSESLHAQIRPLGGCFWLSAEKGGDGGFFPRYLDRIFSFLVGGLFPEKARAGGAPGKGAGKKGKNFGLSGGLAKRPESPQRGGGAGARRFFRFFYFFPGGGGGGGHTRRENGRMVHFRKGGPATGGALDWGLGGGGKGGTKRVPWVGTPSSRGGGV